MDGDSAKDISGGNLVIQRGSDEDASGFSATIVSADGHTVFHCIGKDISDLMNSSDLTDAMKQHGISVDDLSEAIANAMKVDFDIPINDSTDIEVSANAGDNPGIGVEVHIKF